MIVLAFVTTDGGSFLLGEAAADDGNDEDAALPLESESGSELESDVECSLATLLLSPVSWTDQALGPPPVTHLARKRRVWKGTYKYPSCIRNTLSCIPNLRLCCWRLEADRHTSSWIPWLCP